MDIKKISLQKALNSYNVAELLNEDSLSAIGNYVTEGFKTDKSSRSDWEDRNKDAMKIAMQVLEEKSFPWKGAANVKYPLMTLACISFNARAYPVLVPGPNLVKCRVVGEDPAGEKAARAKRLETHMSYQIMEEMNGWEEDMDRLLMVLPLVGCVFKKTYFDPVTGKNCSKLIFADDLVVNYFTRHLNDAERVSHVILLSKNDIISRHRRGIYIEHEVGLSNYSPDKETQGHNPSSDEATPHELVEQHCWLDLDGDDLNEPWIVTIHKETSKVYRIVPRFNPDGVEYNRKNEVVGFKTADYFTKYGFIPSPDGGFYDVGFNTLLYPINAAVNTILNQLIDAGTLNSQQGGFLSRGIRIQGGKIELAQGEWKAVNTIGDDIRKNIYPLPTKEPSQTLYNLFTTLISVGERIGSIQDMLMGENPGQNQPATTSMAVIEQGLKPLTGVIKRLYRSLQEEFRKLYRLNRDYLDPERYYVILDSQAQGRVERTDYVGDETDISPVADPNTISEQQRMARVEALSTRARNVPGYNPRIVESMYLDALGVPNKDQVYPPEGTLPAPKPPIEAQRLQLDSARAEDESKRGWAKLELEYGNAEVDRIKTQNDAIRSAAQAKANLAKAALGVTKQEAEIADMQHERIADSVRLLNEVKTSREKDDERRVQTVEESS